MKAGHILYLYGLLPLGEHSCYVEPETPWVFTPQDLPDLEAAYEEEHALV